MKFIVGGVVPTRLEIYIESRCFMRARIKIEEIPRTLEQGQNHSGCQLILQTTGLNSTRS